MVAQGVVHVKRLQDAIDAPEVKLPTMACDIGRAYLDQIAMCSDKIGGLETPIRTEATSGLTETKESANRRVVWFRSIHLYQRSMMLTHAGDSHGL